LRLLERELQGIDLKDLLVNDSLGLLIELDELISLSLELQVLITGHRGTLNFGKRADSGLV